MKNNENVGVMALISPSTIASLARMSQYVDSHSYELKSAIPEIEAYESAAMMARALGREMAPPFESESTNPLEGEGVAERTAFAIAAKSGVLLKQILWSLSKQPSGDSFFEDLKLAESAIGD